MMPDPTTAISRNAVATSSVKASCTIGRLTRAELAGCTENFTPMATRAFPGNGDGGEIAASVPLLIVLALRFSIR